MAKTQEEYLLERDKKLTASLDTFLKSVDMHLSLSFILGLVLVIVISVPSVELTVLVLKTTIARDLVSIYLAIMLLGLYSLVDFELVAVADLYRRIIHNARRTRKINSNALPSSVAELRATLHGATGLLLMTYYGVSYFVEWALPWFERTLRNILDQKRAARIGIGEFFVRGIIGVLLCIGALVTAYSVCIMVLVMAYLPLVLSIVIMAAINHYATNTDMMLFSAGVVFLLTFHLTISAFVSYRAISSMMFTLTPASNLGPTAS